MNIKKVKEFFIGFVPVFLFELFSFSSFVKPFEYYTLWHYVVLCLFYCVAGYFMYKYYSRKKTLSIGILCGLLFPLFVLIFGYVLLGILYLMYGGK